MSRIPLKFSRRTKHKPPRCQLYQPGFNDVNGCWLEGKWLKVSSKGFDEVAAAHEQLYQGFWDEMEKQSHRGESVRVADMTPAQRQAWEYYSGNGSLDCRHPNGNVGPVNVVLASGLPCMESLNFLKQEGYKVIPQTVQGTLVTGQTRGIPRELLSDDEAPVNIWQLVVEQNRKQSEELCSELAGLISSEGGFEDPVSGVVVSIMVELEESIMRWEVHGGDEYETLESLKERYTRMRADLTSKLGDEFEETYAAVKGAHNECARANLESSDGFLACYVLPKFNPDGTHEAWGDRDFPWGRDD